MTTEFAPVAGALGGALIGLAAVVLMASIGRIAGASGIFGGVLTGQFDSEFRWRAVFLAGSLAGAALVALIAHMPRGTIELSGGTATLAAGGLLVGFGTALGSGCTSGHGICGLPRLSPRSLVATLTFMASAVVTVTVLRHGFGG